VWVVTAADDDVTSRHNVTSLVDKALTLQCPLAAAKRRSSRITWQKHDDDGSWRLLVRDGGRVRVLVTGDVEFDRLLVSDAGFYRCSTSTVSSVPVVLIVHGITVNCFKPHLIVYSRTVQTTSPATWPILHRVYIILLPIPYLM